MIDLARWPALVMAAGLGTRLRPLSQVRAKAALPVAGQALIVRILRWLHDAGVRRVVINLHHKPETITREVGDGSTLGLDVRYSWEGTVLGSAGGPARALPLLAADRFLVINGDTLADVDLRALAERHVISGAWATMAVVPADLAKYNAVTTSGGDEVTGFVPRGTQPVSHVWHFIGVQAMNAAALACVSPDQPSETVRELYPRLIERRPGSVRVFPTPAEFLDIGTPADYLDTVGRIAAREGRPLDRGADCTVDPSATVTGTVLWDRVRVGGGATLTGCVVADDVEIPAGRRYERCAIIRDGGGLLAAPLA